MQNEMVLGMGLFIVGAVLVVVFVNKLVSGIE